MSARIEPLYIVTTKKGTSITSYEQDVKKDHDVYSSIKVVPDDNLKNIKSITCTYNYGKKFADKYRCSFNNPDPTNLMVGDSDDLSTKLMNIFSELILSESHNKIILKGIEYPGCDERQKFINAFVAGASLILCVYNILGQSSKDVFTKNSSNNPFYPLNLGFPSIEVTPNLLNQQLYNYIEYYIYSSREKYGLQIRGLGLEWLIQIKKFWEVFGVCFIDHDIRSPENLLAIHVSTLGFASYFEERVYQAWNKIQENASLGVEQIKLVTSNLLEEIKETNDSYITTLKDQTLDSEKKNLKYAEKLSQKFSDFHSIIEEVSEQHKIGLNEIKEELREFIKNNQDDLVKDIMNTWDYQLKEMNDHHDKTIKNISKMETNLVKKIDQVSNSMISASITKLRSEVETLIDTVSSKKSGLLSDLIKFEKDIKTQIGTYTRKYRSEIKKIEQKIDSKNRNLYETIENKEKEQLEAAETLIDYISQTQDEINETSRILLNDIRSTSQSFVNDEIQSLIHDKSKELIEESFIDNLDQLVDVINMKIQDSLDPAIRHTYKKINNSHQYIIDDINKKYNNLIDLTKYIDKSKYEIDSQMKTILDKHHHIDITIAQVDKIKTQMNIKLKQIDIMIASINKKKQKMDTMYNQLNRHFKLHYNKINTSNQNSPNPIELIQTPHDKYTQNLNDIPNDTNNILLKQVTPVIQLSSDDELNSIIENIDDIPDYHQNLMTILLDIEDNKYVKKRNTLLNYTDDNTFLNDNNILSNDTDHITILNDTEITLL